MHTRTQCKCLPLESDDEEDFGVSGLVETTLGLRGLLEGSLLSNGLGVVLVALDGSSGELLTNLLLSGELVLAGSKLLGEKLGVALDTLLLALRYGDLGNVGNCHLVSILQQKNSVGHTSGCRGHTSTRNKPIYLGFLTYRHDSP